MWTRLRRNLPTTVVKRAQHVLVFPPPVPVIAGLSAAPDEGFAGHADDRDSCATMTASPKKLRRPSPQLICTGKVIQQLAPPVAVGAITAGQQQLDQSHRDVDSGVCGDSDQDLDSLEMMAETADTFNLRCLAYSGGHAAVVTLVTPVEPEVLSQLATRAMVEIEATSNPRAASTPAVFHFCGDRLRCSTTTCGQQAALFGLSVVNVVTLKAVWPAALAGDGVVPVTVAAVLLTRGSNRAGTHREHPALEYHWLEFRSPAEMHRFARRLNRAFGDVHTCQDGDSEPAALLSHVLNLAGCPLLDSSEC